MSGKKHLKSILEKINTTGEIDEECLEGLTLQEKELIHVLYQEGLLAESLAIIDDLDEHREWQTFLNKLTITQKRVVPRWQRVLQYAAVFAGLLAALYWYRIEETPLAEAISENSIRLTVGEGDTRVISQSDSQLLTVAAGQVVGEQTGNKLRYDPDADIDELLYNSLEIPYGKVFDVELSDSTLVHLNSGSRMRYPVKFLAGQPRKVSIQGEAYFKVAKDTKHPFIVQASEVAVEVLGTEFNISSYPEDQEIRTILIEGAVSMTNSAAPQDLVMLKPGYQASWSKTAYTTEVQEADIDLYTSWIDGELVFRNAPFETMILKLERRYDLTIQNKNALLAKKKLNARFNVEVESIEDVLKSINEIQPLEYKIKGRHMIIY